MTDVEFQEAVKKATKLQIGRDYGFVVGTMVPSMTYIRGMVSSANINGFEVWKRAKDGTFPSVVLKPESQKESLRQVINFLKAKDE